MASFIGKNRFTVALLFFVLTLGEWRDNKQRTENPIIDQLGAHAIK